MLDHPGYFMCEHCEMCVSRLAYHDCAEGKAHYTKLFREILDSEAFDPSYAMRAFDTAAAKKDETAHRKRAPRGTWS